MIPGRSACLRCVFAKLGLEDFPPDGFNQGVLGAVAALAGAFQAAEAIKLITQLGTISGNHLLRFDVLRSEFDDMTELTGRSDCPDCGRRS
jgi:molybdopterin/thiamine biosynthesis adenylyltransferase